MRRTSLIAFAAVGTMIVPAATASAQGVDTPGDAFRSGPASAFASRPADALAYGGTWGSKAGAEFDREWTNYKALQRSRDATAIAQFLVEKAKDGRVWAMREAGAFYAGRFGLANHPDKALYWFHQAAINGDEQAAAVVGTAFARGIVVEQDEQLARFWLQRAIDGDDRKTRLDAAKVLASI